MFGVVIGNPMRYNLLKITFIVISLLLILSIVIVIVVKAVFPDSGNGLEFSLFGDLLG